MAFRAYVEALTSKWDNVPEVIRCGREDFLKSHVPVGAGGQVVRVAERFALVALAGELATFLGVTDWPPGEAEKAAATCFRAWLSGRGGIGNKEREQVFSQVRAFIEAHGSSRFEPMDSPENIKIINRVGFREVEMDVVKFYALPESFKSEILSGLDRKSAIRTLIEAGWLETDSNGKATRPVRLPGLGQKRVYILNADKIFEGEKA
jgi:putative DNA primase/helicase